MMPTGTRGRRKRGMARKQDTDLELDSTARGGRMLELRSRLGLSRDVFARLLPVSTRSLATIESGAKPRESLRRRMIELRRIVAALEEVMASETIGERMATPNDAFGRLMPLEVIERGEVDRIWLMIFLLRSGVPG